MASISSTSSLDFLDIDSLLTISAQATDIGLALNLTQNPYIDRETAQAITQQYSHDMGPGGKGKLSQFVMQYNQTTSNIGPNHGGQAILAKKGAFLSHSSTHGGPAANAQTVFIPLGGSVQGSTTGAHGTPNSSNPSQSLGVALNHPETFVNTAALGSPAEIIAQTQCHPRYTGDYKTLIDNGDWCDVLNTAKLSDNDLLHLQGNGCGLSLTPHLHNNDIYDVNGNSQLNGTTQKPQQFAGFTSGISHDIITQSHISPASQQNGEKNEYCLPLPVSSLLLPVDYSQIAKPAAFDIAQTLFSQLALQDPFAHLEINSAITPTSNHDNSGKSSTNTSRPGGVVNRRVQGAVPARNSNMNDDLGNSIDPSHTTPLVSSMSTPTSSKRASILSAQLAQHQQEQRSNAKRFYLQMLTSNFFNISTEFHCDYAIQSRGTLAHLNALYAKFNQTFMSDFIKWRLQYITSDILRLNIPGQIRTAVGHNNTEGGDEDVDDGDDVDGMGDNTDNTFGINNQNQNTINNQDNNNTDSDSSYVNKREMMQILQQQNIFQADLLASGGDLLYLLETLSKSTNPLESSSLTAQSQRLADHLKAIRNEVDTTSEQASNLRYLSLDEVYNHHQNGELKQSQHTLFATNLVGEQYFMAKPMHTLLSWHKPLLSLGHNHVNPVPSLITFGSSPIVHNTRHTLPAGDERHLEFPHLTTPQESTGIYAINGAEEKRVYDVQYEYLSPSQINHHAETCPEYMGMLANRPEHKRCISWRSTAKINTRTGQVVQNEMFGVLRDVPSHSIQMNNNMDDIDEGTQTNNANNIGGSSGLNQLPLLGGSTPVPLLQNNNSNQSNSGMNAPPLLTTTTSSLDSTSTTDLPVLQNDSLVAGNTISDDQLPISTTNTKNPSQNSQPKNNFLTAATNLYNCLQNDPRKPSLHPTPGFGVAPEPPLTALQSLCGYDPHSTFKIPTPIPLSIDPDPQRSLQHILRQNHNNPTVSAMQRRDHRDTSNAWGATILIEHITPDPIIFSNKGMCSTVKTYYRKSGDQHHVSEAEIRAKLGSSAIGELVVLDAKDPTPIAYFRLHEREYITVLENELYISVLSRSRVPRMYYDYLLVYTPVNDPDPLISEDHSKSVAPCGRKLEKLQRKQSRITRSLLNKEVENSLISGGESNSNTVSGDVTSMTTAPTQNIQSAHFIANFNEDLESSSDEEGDEELINVKYRTYTVNEEIRTDTLETDADHVQFKEVKYKWSLRRLPAVYTAGVVLPLCVIPNPLELHPHLQRWASSIVSRHLSTAQPVSIVTQRDGKATGVAIVGQKGVSVAPNIYITQEQISVWFSHQIDYEYGLNQVCNYDTQLMSVLLPAVNLWDIGRTVLARCTGAKYRGYSNASRAANLTVDQANIIPQLKPFGPNGPEPTETGRQESSGATMNQYDGNGFITIPLTEENTQRSIKELESVCLPEEVCIMTAALVGMAKLHRNGIVRHLNYNTSSIDCGYYNLRYDHYLSEQKKLDNFVIQHNDTQNHNRMKYADNPNWQPERLTRTLIRQHAQLIEANRFNRLCFPAADKEKHLHMRIHEFGLIVGRQLQFAAQRDISSQKSTQMFCQYMPVGNMGGDENNKDGNNVTNPTQNNPNIIADDKIINFNANSSLNTTIAPRGDPTSLHALSRDQHVDELADFLATLFYTEEQSPSLRIRQPLLNPRLLHQSLYNTSAHILRCMLFILKTLRRTPWHMSEALVEHLKTAKYSIDIYNPEYDFVGILPVVQTQLRGNRIPESLRILRTPPPTPYAALLTGSKFKTTSRGNDIFPSSDSLLKGVVSHDCVLHIEHISNIVPPLTPQTRDYLINIAATPAPPFIDDIATPLTPTQSTLGIVSETLPPPSQPQIPGVVPAITAPSKIVPQPLPPSQPHTAQITATSSKTNSEDNDTRDTALILSKGTVLHAFKIHDENNQYTRGDDDNTTTTITMAGRGNVLQKKKAAEHPIKVALSKKNVYTLEAVDYLPAPRLSAQPPNGLCIVSQSKADFAECMVEQWLCSAIDPRILIALNKGPLYNYDPAASLLGTGGAIAAGNNANPSQNSANSVDEGIKRFIEQDPLCNAKLLYNLSNGTNTLSYFLQLLSPSFHNDSLLATLYNAYQRQDSFLILGWPRLPEPRMFEFKDYFSPAGTFGAYPGAEIKLADAHILRRHEMVLSYERGLHAEKISYILDHDAVQRFRATDKVDNIIPPTEDLCAVLGREEFKITRPYGLRLVSDPQTIAANGNVALDLSAKAAASQQAGGTLMVGGAPPGTSNNPNMANINGNNASQDDNSSAAATSNNTPIYLKTYIHHLLSDKFQYDANKNINIVTLRDIVQRAHLHNLMSQYTYYTSSFTSLLDVLYAHLSYQFEKHVYLLDPSETGYTTGLNGWYGFCMNGNPPMTNPEINGNSGVISSSSGGATAATRTSLMNSAIASGVSASAVAAIANTAPIGVPGATKTKRTPKVIKDELTEYYFRMQSDSPGELAQALTQCLKRARDNCGEQTWGIFYYPVPAAQYPTYYSLVKRPMCLDTLHRRLRDQAYPSPDAFLADLALIQQASIMFNGPESPVTESAAKIVDEVRGYVYQDVQSRYNSIWKPFLGLTEMRYEMNKIIREQIAIFRSDPAFAEHSTVFGEVPTQSNYVKAITGDKVALETLSNTFFHSFSRFTKHLDIMVTNCQRFNGVDSHYSQLALVTRTQLLSQIEPSITEKMRSIKHVDDLRFELGFKGTKATKGQLTKLYTECLSWCLQESLDREIKVQLAQNTSSSRASTTAAVSSIRGITGDTSMAIPGSTSVAPFGGESVGDLDTGLFSPGGPGGATPGPISSGPAGRRSTKGGASTVGRKKATKRKKKNNGSSDESADDSDSDWE